MSRIAAFVFLVCLVGVVGGARGAPSATTIEVWTDRVPAAIKAEVGGVAASLPRFASGDRVFVRVTFDEPLLAVRAATSSTGRVVGSGPTIAGATALVEVDAVVPGQLLVVELVDAVSASGKTASTVALVAPFTADYVPGAPGGPNMLDLLGFLRWHDGGSLLADFDLDGSLTAADVLGVIAAIGAAGPSDAPAPLVSSGPTLFVPAGGVSREVTLTLRDAFVAAEDLSVSIATSDASVLPVKNVVVSRRGGELTLRAAAAPGVQATASLTVTVSNGTAQTQRQVAAVIRPDRAPEARVTTDGFLGAAPLVVTFDAGRSADELENIASYAWSFGDGGTATGPQVSHVFAAAGDYRVRCTVTDDSGLSSVAERVVTVSAAPFDLAARGGPGQITEAEAARFLWQAAFGPTEAEIAEVIARGYEGWIDHQVSLVPTLRRPVGGDVTVVSYSPYINAAADQLRQRLAWALVQVITLGQDGDTQSVAYTYDMYIRHAFGYPATGAEAAASGNFRELLSEVTNQAKMGDWLTYRDNVKADPVAGTAPDENYARELMQLFTIGLWELTPDGRRARDVFGDEVPTYGAEDVAQFARVFTGYRGNGVTGVPSGASRMSMSASRHEFGPKQLLDYAGAVPPAGVVPLRSSSSQNGLADVEDALDNVFHHPSCPPFIAELLIKRFVSSNPSRGYVGRVAEAFRGEGPYGTGVRGDLAATVKAILLDDEARNPDYARNEFAGKIIEPFVFVVSAARAMGMTDPAVNTGSTLQSQIGQTHYQMPSVFNFYRPEFSPANTEISAAGLTAPEMQIFTESQAIGTTQAVEREILRRTNGVPRWDAGLRTELVALAAADPAALVERIEAVFMRGSTPRVREIIRAAVAATPVNEQGGEQRVNLAVYLYLMNPEARVLR